MASELESLEIAPRKSVGGWLLLLCVSLTMFVPLRQLAEAASVFKVFQAGGWDSRQPAVILGIILVLTAVCIGFSLVSGVMLWQKKQIGVTLSRRFLLFQFFFTLLSTVIFFEPIGFVSAKSILDTSIIKGLFMSLGYTVIWESYFRKSKRVAETFGEIKPGFDYRFVGLLLGISILVVLIVFGSKGLPNASAGKAIGAPNNANKHLTFEQDGFSIDLPQAFPLPTREVVETQTQSGKVVTYYWSTQAGVNTINFGYSRIAEAALRMNSVDQILLNAVNGASGKSNMQLKSVSDIRLGEVAGKTARMSGNNDGVDIFMRIDVYVKNDRLYMVTYGSAIQDNTMTPSAESVFRSLNLH